MTLYSCSSSGELSEIVPANSKLDSAGFAGVHTVPVLSLATARNAVRRVRMAVASVIGDADERRIELRVQLPPWRMICSLRIESQRGAARGTGWLAGPRTVITCGHCVYSLSDFGGWASSITVTPGRNWREAPFGSIRSTNFSCADRWLASSDLDADIGAIHLEEDIGQQVGWFGYDQASVPTLRESQVVVTGYPEKADSFDNLWSASGRVVAVTLSRLFYEADTSDGQSGSPVWLAANPASLPRVIAVHAYEKEASPQNFGPSNSATLLTSDTTSLIAFWRDVASTSR